MRQLRLFVVGFAVLGAAGLAGCGSSEDPPSEQQFLDDAMTALEKAGFEPQEQNDGTGRVLGELGVKDDIRKLDEKYDSEPEDERGVKFTIPGGEPIVCMASLLIAPEGFGEGEFGVAVSPDGMEVATMEETEADVEADPSSHIDLGVCSNDFKSAMGWSR